MGGGWWRGPRAAAGARAPGAGGRGRPLEREPNRHLRSGVREGPLVAGGEPGRGSRQHGRCAPGKGPRSLSAGWISGFTLCVCVRSFRLKSGARQKVVFSQEPPIFQAVLVVFSFQIILSGQELGEVQILFAVSLSPHYKKEKKKSLYWIFLCGESWKGDITL